MTHGKRIKKQSKRTTLRLKYKVERKVKEHHRKLKKDQKKRPWKYPKKRKDPGIPNEVPFKAQIIQEAQELKEIEEARRQQRRTELKLRRKEEKANLFNSNRNLEDLVGDVEKRSKEFEGRSLDGATTLSFTDKSAKAYYKELKKVVEAADVVLQVLDARDPLGCRCMPLEDLVRSYPDKRLVLVLNKADLIPRSNLEAWLKYLRNFSPTLLFKASTQCQSDNISRINKKALKSDRLNLNSSKCVGADLLMELLKNYSRNCGIKTSIVVGVVGMPNVGKSSLINSLKRSKACNVGAMPGITKTLQEITLDSKVKLLDCPGVILPSSNTSDAASSLRNALKIEDLEDPITPVEAIIKRTGQVKMMLHYRVDHFKDTHEFLALYAKRSGKLSKGGLPNVEAAAKSVLHDWNTGRISYHTLPPSLEVTESSATVVSSFAKEFEIDNITSNEEGLISSLDCVDPSKTVCIESLKEVTSLNEGESDDEEPMEEEGSTSDLLPENVAVTIKDKNEPVVVTEEKKPRWETVPEEIDYSAVNLKKLQKKRAKKLRKEHSRNLKRTDQLVGAFEMLQSM